MSAFRWTKYNRDVFSWLNRNAPAVQALASVASVLVTILLALITRKYVGLTQELARAARGQLRLQEHSAASEAAQLLTLIDVFLGSFSRFPENEQHRERIRDVGLWKHSDVTTLGALAASVLGSGSGVHDVIQKLNWIRKMAEEVQQTSREEGFSWNHFPWERWRRELREARTALDRMRGATEGVLAAHDPSQE